MYHSADHSAVHTADHAADAINWRGPVAGPHTGAGGGGLLEGPMGRPFNGGRGGPVWQPLWGFLGGGSGLRQCVSHEKSRDQIQTETETTRNPVIRLRLRQGTM